MVTTPADPNSGSSPPSRVSRASRKLESPSLRQVPSPVGEPEHDAPATMMRPSCWTAAARATKGPIEGRLTRPSWEKDGSRPPAAARALPGSPERRRRRGRRRARLRPHPRIQRGVRGTSGATLPVGEHVDRGSVPATLVHPRAGRRSGPSGWRLSLDPPVSGYERPSARWTVPPIFSSSRIIPVRRVMPVFVPMPSSPSRRAPGSVSSVASRCSAPRSARASTTRPSSKRSSTPATSTPPWLVGTVKRTVPVADASCGPVKTSPEGMLRRPSELIQVRPETSRVRSVPGAWRRISRTVESRSTRRAWRSESACQAATGSRPPGRSRNSARSTRPAKAAVPIPACWASAGVGHTVTHQRWCSAASRSGRRARAARAVRPGSTAESAVTLSGEWTAMRASADCASARASGAKPSRWASVAADHQDSSAPSSSTRSSGQAPRRRIARWRASTSGAAPAPARTRTCWPARTSRQ